MRQWSHPRHRERGRAVASRRRERSDRRPRGIGAGGGPDPTYVDRVLANRSVEGLPASSILPNVSSDDPGPSVASRYPVLGGWLSGAPANHPWAFLLESSDPHVAPLAEAMEAILADLEGANPVRLPRKRAAFAQDIDGALNLRAELNVGSVLARSGCAFAFGGDGEADYECPTPSGTAWAEVTTKSRDDLSRLYDELTEALRGHSVVAELRMAQRMLVIPEPQRRAACRRVVEAVEAMTGSYGSVALPEIEGGVTLTTPSLFGGPHVVVDTSSPELTAHFKAVEQFVRNAIADKTEQSVRGHWSPDTVLVVDASRLGTSWLRPDAVWRARLEAMDLPWGALPFAAVAVVWSDLLQVGFHGACVTRPDLSESVVQLLRHLGFGSGL